jgi:hypothetical protein
LGIYARSQLARGRFAGMSARATRINPCLCWFACCFRSCPARTGTLESIAVENVTETLGIGSRAPDFSLKAANQEGDFSLSALRARGPVIVEFLRGTW